MRSESEFDIGRQGIDTQYERDHINYRPAIGKYNHKIVRTGYGLPADTARQILEPLEKVGKISVVSVWEDTVDTFEKVNEIEERLSEKLKDITVPIPERFKEEIEQAASRLGYPDVKEITFDLYKETFKNQTLPDASLIQDVFEEYMGDIYGDLNAELYQDVAEIQNDLEDLVDFLGKALLGQIVPMEKVPTKLSKDDPKLEEIHEREKQMLNEYAELLKSKAVREKAYHDLAKNAPGSEEYYKATEAYDQAKRDVINIEKRLFTKTEVSELVQQKIADANVLINLIDNTIDFDPYQETKYELLYGLMKQFPSKEDARRVLTKMQAILKLSVDNKREESSAMRLNLRGLASRNTKQKINKTLINGVHLRNEIFGEVYDALKHMDGVPAIPDFEVLMDHMVEGADVAEQMYRDESMDFYKIHSLDTELRREKLASVINKDAARSAYRLIDDVLNYSNDINRKWPEEAELTKWLNDYMEYSKNK